MLHELSVKFNNFLLSLSDAMDIASPPIASHQLRTAFVAWKLAKEARLSSESIERIYLAALLHDIGALSLEEKVQLHRGFEKINVETHCILGEALFSLSPLLRNSAPIVRWHHRPWEEWEKLGATITTPFVLESQILFLADEIERAVNRGEYILHQVDGVRSLVHFLERSKIHPDLVAIFQTLSGHEDFWLDLALSRLYSLLLHYGPFRSREIGREDIFSISAVFRHVIDFKSRFTATHSTGVAQCAVSLSRYFGLTDSETEQMQIAGYLHDLGKLAVPNSLLEKPGKLTKREFDVVKQHAYFTYTVLNTIGGLGTIAEWAAFHHEKLDGSGYPFHISEERLNIGSRILSVSDIFTALLEDRPYRKSMATESIGHVMKPLAQRGALDSGIVKILLENVGDIAHTVRTAQGESEEFFEEKFSRLRPFGTRD